MSTEPTQKQIETFKAVWALADREGDDGNRVRRALAAVLALADEGKSPSTSTSVKVVLDDGINEIGVMETTILIPGAIYFDTNSQRELRAYADDDTELAVFGSGEWRYALLAPGRDETP